jgi:LDH2 family malate/lactate/ureidoglycolate dehydrogenase
VKASRNELRALFKQAFEGVGFDFGGYESAADMIVWGQMHGLDSFAMIRKRLPDFEQRRRLQIEPCSLESKESNKEHSVIDAKGNSCIVAAGIALDITYVEAMTSGVADATVLNCHDRKLVIKKLADCAKRGVVCLAYWRDDKTLKVVTSDTGVCCPEYSQYPLKDLLGGEYLNENHQQSLFVVCATESAGLQEYISKNLAELQGIKTVVISPTMMKSSYTTALTDGIEIDRDFWSELTVLGQEVLVESTEQSRMGAG